MNPYSEDTLIHAVYEALSAIEYKQMTKISVTDPLTGKTPDTKILRAAICKSARKLNCKVNTRTRHGILFARKEKLPARKPKKRKLLPPKPIKKKSVAKMVSERLLELKPREALTIDMKDINLGTVRSAITCHSQATGVNYTTAIKRDKNLYVRRIN